MPKTVLDTKQLGLAELEHELTHHTELPCTAFSNVLETIIEKIGNYVSWFWVLAVGTIVYAVISRYVFGQGTVLLEEVQWHLAGAAWLIGLSYTLVHDDHVRVDVIHENLSLRAQAWIEFLGILILLLPFLTLSLGELLPYAQASFTQGEQSQSPNGLPMRWILKSVLPLAIFLLILASLARLSRVTALLFNFPKPLLPTPKNNTQKEKA